MKDSSTSPDTTEPAGESSAPGIVPPRPARAVAPGAVASGTVGPATVEPGPTARRPAVGGWAALPVVYIVWGSTYLAIRVGVETIPPLLLAGVRYLIAGLILVPVAIRRGPAAVRAVGVDGSA